MEAATFGEYVIKELGAYHKSALERDPAWFASEINQRAYLDFQMQVMALWISQQQKAEIAAANFVKVN